MSTSLVVNVSRAALLMAALAGASFAQDVEPLGDDFQVNEGTSGFQVAPAVGVAGTNRFVVAWTSQDPAGNDTSSSSLVARRFDADGGAASGDFQVNTYTPGPQSIPSIRMEPSGEFVVAWNYVYYLPFFPDTIVLTTQRFDAAGVAIGGEFDVAGDAGYSYISRGTIGGDGPGGFVGVMGSSSVFGARMAADGTLIESLTFSETPAGTDNRPRVDADSLGNFVVVWNSQNSPTGDDNSGSSIQARPFDASGQPLSGQFQVNLTTTGEQRWPTVSLLDDGRYLVTWTDLGVGDGDNSRIQGRILDLAGGPGSAEFQINTVTTRTQLYANVTAIGDRAFVVVWQSDASSGPDVDEWSIQARIVDPQAGALGTDFQVNTYTSGSQTRPHVDASGDDFVVVWQSLGSPGNDGDEESVLARRFRLGGVFSDGFESGDISRWSDAQGDR